MQHPLAQIEIVAFDSSLTLFLARENTSVNLFRQSFPMSEYLQEYNEGKVK